jgi:hypothetical protein
VLVLGEGWRSAADVDVFAVLMLSEGQRSAANVAAYETEVRSLLWRSSEGGSTPTSSLTISSYVPFFSYTMFLKPVYSNESKLSGKVLSGPNKTVYD